MLIDIHTRKPITCIPHKENYDTWKKGLSDAEFEAVMSEISNRIGGDEIATSSWLPGRIWIDTPFQPIWEKACSKNPEAAAKFFGLLVWRALQEDPGHWAFGRYEKDGVPIEGMTYFRIADDNI